MYLLEIFFLDIFIRLRCSFKIFPLPLKEISKICNTSKKGFPHKFISENRCLYVGKIPDEIFWEDDDLSSYKKNNKNLIMFNLKSSLLEYCLDNVKLIIDFINQLNSVLTKYNLNFLSNSYSVSSLSYKIFFKKCNSKGVEQRISKKHEEFLRDSYFGGRCEVFGNLKDDEFIKYFDFSGMYGQCMIENFHSGEGSFENLKNFNKPGFYTVEYLSNFDYLPVLPSRQELGKLFFLNQKSVGTFWFEEIILFLQEGGSILKILNSFVFDRYEQTFIEFIEKFDEIKKKNDFCKTLGKLIINSLYGGMAMREDDSFCHLTYSEIELLYLIENLNVLKFYSVNNVFVLEIQNDFKSRFYFKTKAKKNSVRNVSYAAAITSKARIKLYKAMQSVINDGGRLLYCDTDSIYAAYPNNDKRQKTPLFEWLEFYDDGIFITSKSYAFKNNSKEGVSSKGVNNKEKSLAYLKNCFYNEIDFDLRIDPNLSKIFFTGEIKINDYDKRIFINNKKDTKPISILSNPDI